MPGVVIMSLFSSFGLGGPLLPGSASGDAAGAHSLHGPEHRAAVRQQLIEARDAFAITPEVCWAAATLGQHLADVLLSLKPQCLGAYWPVRSEFNPWQGWPRHKQLTTLQRALPWAQRNPRQMRYRVWDGSEPHVHDECGIPSSDGVEIRPDVLLVPCVGFTRTGWRLGYGGGYFDRYLADHHDVFTIGVAWACCELPAGVFEPQMHDRPLNLVITQNGVLESAPQSAWPL